MVIIGVESSSHALSAFRLKTYKNPLKTFLKVFVLKNAHMRLGLTKV